jgi:hypothetical protein
MFTGIIIGLGIAGLILYVHKVGLPAVLSEIRSAGASVEAAINRHSARQAQVAALRPPIIRPGPLPSTAPGPDREMPNAP